MTHVTEMADGTRQKKSLTGWNYEACSVTSGRITAGLCIVQPGHLDEMMHALGSAWILAAATVCMALDWFCGLRKGAISV
jgi:hypothetical protein